MPQPMRRPNPPPNPASALGTRPRRLPPPPPRPVRPPPTAPPPPDPYVYDPAARPSPAKPKIVAVYKTFSGPEFVAASLASVYPFVDGVVMAHSSVGWDGTAGNTVEAPARAWTDGHDLQNKVKHLACPAAEQVAQYRFALDAARRAFDPDFFLVVDSDEVWPADDLRRALARLAGDRAHVRVTCRMRTYVKSCLFRVTPPEPCRPTVFLRNVPGLEPAGPRASRVGPAACWEDVAFDHFSYTRDCDADVFAKVATSTVGDGCRTLDLAAWRRDKWDRLPGGAVDLHTTVGHAQAWRRVTEVAVADLPEIVRGHSLVLRHAAERRAAWAGLGGPVSVIVPTCRPEAAVADLVAEIRRRSTGEFEVIATCRPVSAAANRNAGLDAARYDRVVMVDDDVTDLPAGWNQLLARHLDEPDVVMASARLFKPDGSPGHLMGGAKFRPGQVTEAAERKLATACVAFRKTGLRFDENFEGSGFEDDDYAAMLVRENPAARFVVDNGVAVTHLNERKNQTGETWAKNQAYFQRKWSSR